MILDELAKIECQAIDAFAEDWINRHPDPFKENRSHPPRPREDRDAITNELRSKLSTLDTLQDQDLLHEFWMNYSIQNTLDTSHLAGQKISKINHGFWEHLAMLHASEEALPTYRNPNLSLRTSQYLNRGFLQTLLDCWSNSTPERDYRRFISTTSGIAPITKVTPQNIPAGANLPIVQRGALKGLLIAAHRMQLTRGEFFRIPVEDSFQINRAFERHEILERAAAQIPSNSACVVFGPPWLSGIQLCGWEGRSSYLAISPTRAMSQWSFYTSAISELIKIQLEKFEHVLITFQGGALSPVICDHIVQDEEIPANAVTFFDLGRLLDIDAGVDLSKTGSPLPSRRTEKLGIFAPWTNSGKAYIPPGTTHAG